MEGVEPVQSGAAGPVAPGAQPAPPTSTKSKGWLNVNRSSLTKKDWKQATPEGRDQMKNRYWGDHHERKDGMRTSCLAMHANSLRHSGQHAVVMHDIT